MSVKVPASDAAVAAIPWRFLDAPLQRRYQVVLKRLGWPEGNSTTALQTLGVTSADAGEGVSTVAAHLAAVAAAQPDCEVLLVDANIAAPAQHLRFGLAGKPGFAELLQSGGDTPTAIRGTAVPNLAVLPAGKASGHASRVHDVLELAAGVKELAAGFDLAVFDLPPAGKVSLALRFASVLDGVLLVIAAGRTSRDAAVRTIELLRRAHANVVGVVFNRAESDR